jgi:ATP/ADP translocase
MQRKQSDKGTKKNDVNVEGSLLSKTAHLFQTVPALAALFCEVISFQSLSTVLNICFVRKLKESMPLDTDRASFTGRFYAYINATSGLMQFFVLPLARKYLEPKWAYQFMPLVLVPCLAYATIQASGASSLWMTAAALFSLKTLDYSLRNIVNEMVFQPLDFDSRYLGKEVIGVFANRFGKSGMSIILSLLMAQFPGMGAPELSQLSLGVASLWTMCSFWLSRNVVSNEEAERRVKERQSKKGN